MIESSGYNVKVKELGHIRIDLGTPKNFIRLLSISIPLKPIQHFSASQIAIECTPKWDHLVSISPTLYARAFAPKKYKP